MACALIDESDFKSIAGFSEDNAEYWSCLGVLFCAVRKGDAINIHVASDKNNIRNLRKGCKLFISHMLLTYKWCKMLIATVSTDNKSVYNLCRKLGFQDLGLFSFEGGNANIMVIKA